MGQNTNRTKYKDSKIQTRQNIKEKMQIAKKKNVTKYNYNKIQMEQNANRTKCKKIPKYTGLEHRQTLRACTTIVICKLKLKKDNLKFEIWKKKIRNLGEKGWKFGKKIEIWEKI